MITAIYIYCLKKGVSMEEYRKWSIERDQKTVKSFKGVEKFDVHIIEGPDKRCDIFEVINVESWDRWKEITSSPEMEDIKFEHKQLVDRDSMTCFYGKIIE
ncbi:MAG: hypothetical protein WCJ54_00800 [Actinomycetota bacterium]